MRTKLLVVLASALLGAQSAWAQFTSGEIATLKTIAALAALSTSTELRIEGGNIRVTNGRGHTDIAEPADANGLGNIHLGYSETLGRTLSRTGVHGISTGRGNDWTSYGWLNFGRESDCLGKYCAIFGFQNKAYEYGSVLGGANNVAGTANPSVDNSVYATVCGGRGNQARAYASVVAGGDGNVTSLSALYSAIGGGALNVAEGDYCYLAGGDSNRCLDSSLAAAIIGGRASLADGYWPTITGGFARATPAFSLNHVRVGSAAASTISANLTSP